MPLTYGEGGEGTQAKALSWVGHFEKVVDVICDWSLTTMSDFHLSKALLPICSQLSIFGCDGARAETEGDELIMMSKWQ